MLFPYQIRNSAKIKGFNPFSTEDRHFLGSPIFIYHYHLSLLDNKRSEASSVSPCFLSSGFFQIVKKKSRQSIKQQNIYIMLP